MKPVFTLKSNREYLVTKDIQDLLMWMFGEGEEPKWCFISNRSLIETVIMIKIDNLTNKITNEYKNKFLTLNSFPFKMNLLAPGSKETCFPVTPHIFQKQSKKTVDKDSLKKPPADYYLLSEQELFLNKFPIPKG